MQGFLPAPQGRLGRRLRRSHTIGLFIIDRPAGVCSLALAGGSNHNPPNLVSTSNGPRFGAPWAPDRPGARYKCICTLVYNATSLLRGCEARVSCISRTELSRQVAPADRRHVHSNAPMRAAAAARRLYDPGSGPAAKPRPITKAVRSIQRDTDRRNARHSMHGMGKGPSSAAQHSAAVHIAADGAGIVAHVVGAAEASRRPGAAGFGCRYA